MKSQSKKTMMEIGSHVGKKRKADDLSDFFNISDSGPDSDDSLFISSPFLPTTEKRLAPQFSPRRRSERLIQRHQSTSTVKELLNDFEAQQHVRSLITRARRRRNSSSLRVRRGRDR